MNHSNKNSFAKHVVDRMAERGKRLAIGNVPEIEASMTTLEIPRTPKNVKAVQDEIALRNYSEGINFRTQTLAAMRA